MESNVQNPGEPTQAGGEPAQAQPTGQPAAPPEPTSPPTQPSGQPAQVESYWQSQHDKLKAQYEGPEFQQKEQLWNLFKSRPDAAQAADEYLKANPQGAPTETPQPSQPGFDPTVDFNAEDLSNPNTPTGKYFDSRVQEVAGSLVDKKLQKLEQAQQRQSYEQYLTTQKKYTPEQARAYVDLLMNPTPEFVQEFLMGKAADTFVAAPPAAPAAPAGPGLGPVSATQAAPPPTGAVQGAQPAPQSEADKLFERIKAADGGPLPLKS